MRKRNILFLIVLLSFFLYQNAQGQNAKAVQWIAEPQFNWAWDFNEGVARVKQDDKYGYIDREGKWII
jgi:hypothetical protein